MADDVYLVTDQHPQDRAGARSPLAHVERTAIPGPASVSITEHPDTAHLIIRAAPDNPALEEELQNLGLNLPEPLYSSTAEATAIRWLSPDEWLLTLPAESGFALESRLRAELDENCAVVNVSGGQTLLQISGEKAEELLRKSTPYDIHPANFPQGKVVSTVFAKTQALIRRTAPAQFELILRRSFAPYLWHWLRDAAQEYGLNLPAPPASSP